MITGSLRLTPMIILIALFTLTAVPAVAKGYPEAVAGEFVIEAFAFDQLGGGRILIRFKECLGY
ncbi:MAG: hypothetical protein NWQ24_05620 [Haliea sp.]|nr:hypothetical protein [Haliea sp.]